MAAGAAGRETTRAAPAGEGVQLIERDIEAPEVFSVEDDALWDGRPSLGGIWVAAPGVTDPERIIIRNAANGKFVIGALFRRERDNPGPALQLSSDAAAALGILAGAPTRIDIVALRREEVSEPAAARSADAPQPVAQVGAQTAARPPAGEIVGTPAVATTDAIADVADRFGAPDVGPATDPATDVADVSSLAPQTGARNGTGFLGRIFDRKSTAAPISRAETRPGEPLAGGAAAQAIATTPLGGEPIRSASLAPVATGGPSIQIGIFSVERNARDAATSLTGAGLAPTVLAQESRGHPVWRVVVTPSAGAPDTAAVIRKAKSLGFTDAFATEG